MKYLFVAGLMCIVVLMYIAICNIGRIRHKPYLDYTKNVYDKSEKAEVFFYSAKTFTYTSYRFDLVNGKWKYRINFENVIFAVVGGFIILMYVFVWIRQGFFMERDARIYLLMIILMIIAIVMYRPLSAYAFMRKNMKKKR